MWGTKRERMEHLRSQGISSKDIKQVQKRVQIGDMVRIPQVFEEDTRGKPSGGVTSGTVIGKYPNLFVIRTGRGYTSFRWAELAASRRVVWKRQI